MFNPDGKKNEGEKNQQPTKAAADFFYKHTKSHVQYQRGKIEFRAEAYSTFHFNCSFKYLSLFCLDVKLHLDHPKAW